MGRSGYYSAPEVKEAAMEYGRRAQLAGAGDREATDITLDATLSDALFKVKCLCVC
jgi:hypothetical protein